MNSQNQLNPQAPIPISICSKDGDALAALLQVFQESAQNNNLFSISQVVANPEQLDTENVEILLADPNLGAACVSRCHKLKWFQSTWAGNAPLLKLDKQDYELTCARGIFDVQIREYVFTYLLAFVRKVFEMDEQKTPEPVWQSVLPSYLHGKTLGILGTGSLAQALLPVAEVFGLKVIGLSRTGKAVTGFTHVYKGTEKNIFANQADFVVNVLPDTAETLGFLNSIFFTNMKANSLLINAGRGSAIEEDALLDGLKNRTPQLAVLDVFNVEPLPKDHRFWHHPNILITHHTAAISRLEDIVEVFIDNLSRFVAGETLRNKLDWDKGY